MRPILGLGFDRGVPPPVEMDDPRGRGQVQSRPARAQRENHRPGATACARKRR